MLAHDIIMQSISVKDIVGQLRQARHRSVVQTQVCMTNVESIVVLSDDACKCRINMYLFTKPTLSCSKILARDKACGVRTCIQSPFLF
jgi:hypothetical protein